MRVHVHLLIWARLAATLFFAVGAASAAGPGRDFTGFYSLSNVVELGSQVRLAISLDIVNRSGADVKNAALWMDSPHSGKSAKTFSGISLPPRKPVHLEDQLTIGSQEYRRWLHGSLPSFWIAYKNGKGQQKQHKIELVPQHAGTGAGI